MNWDRIEGEWKQFKGTIKEEWGRLTDDRLDVIAGKREQLVGALQESYGIARHLAEQLVVDWEERNKHLFDAQSSNGTKRRRKVA